MQDAVPQFYGAPYYGLPTYGARRGRRPMAPLNVRPIPPPPSLSSTGLCTTFPTNVGGPPQVGSRGFVAACPPGVR
jgi:hypothetical protein